MIRYFLMTTLLVIGLPESAMGKQLLVNTSNPNCSVQGHPFCSIQNAIDAAEPGDKVRVQKGLYLENILIDKASIDLNCSHNAIIDGVSSPSVSVVTITADRVKVKGCEIRNGDEGIQASLGHLNKVSIEDCDIHHNNNEGIEIDGTGNQVKNNSVHDNEYGIAMINGSNNRLIGNLVYDNAEMGLYIEEENSSIVWGNEVKNNIDGIGTFENINTTFSENIANNNTRCGFCLENDKDSIFEDNRANENATGFLLDHIKDSTFEGNSANKNVTGFLLEYVKNSTFEGNSANKNMNFGFVDPSSGTGTAGTANTYYDNKCKKNGLNGSNPIGLCDF